MFCRQEQRRDAALGNDRVGVSMDFVPVYLQVNFIDGHQLKGLCWPYVAVVATDKRIPCRRERGNISLLHPLHDAVFSAEYPVDFHSICGVDVEVAYHTPYTVIDSSLE